MCLVDTELLLEMDLLASGLELLGFLEFSAWRNGMRFSTSGTGLGGQLLELSRSRGRTESTGADFYELES